MVPGHHLRLVDPGGPQLPPVGVGSRLRVGLNLEEEGSSIGGVGSVAGDGDDGGAYGVLDKV